MCGYFTRIRKKWDFYRMLEGKATIRPTLAIPRRIKRITLR